MKVRKDVYTFNNNVIQNICSEIEWIKEILLHFTFNTYLPTILKFILQFEITESPLRMLPYAPWILFGVFDDVENWQDNEFQTTFYHFMVHKRWDWNVKNGKRKTGNKREKRVKALPSQMNKK